MPIEDIYENEYIVLKRLFGNENISSRIGRLNEIYNYTEDIWHTYINNIPGRLVKYLLIAEAPPWRDNGEQPQYFLDPNSESRTLMRAFKNAFMPGQEIDDIERIISCFSENGLLLIDSIPFSMKYTGKRNSRHYKKLIDLSVHSYMIEKLLNNQFVFSSHLRIAFGYEVNARAIIDSLEGILRFPGQSFRINENMICTNRSHYPDADVIRSIYNINVV